MNINVLFFSVLKDITGTAEMQWHGPTDATLNDLLVDLYGHWPALREWDPSLLLAINQSYAERAAILPANAEVAIMPPVQGG